MRCGRGSAAGRDGPLASAVPTPPPSPRPSRRHTLGRLAAVQRRRLRLQVDAWRQTRLLSPILTVVSGTALAQALVFAARPVLTRLYAPAAWGELTLFVTTVAVLSTVASLGYRSAVLLPGRQDEAANVFGLALGAAVATTLAVAVAVAAGVAAGWIGPIWALLPVALLALDAEQTAEKWLGRADAFGVISGARVVQQVGVVAVQLGAGLAGAAAGWLVGGAALGYVAAGAVAGLGVSRLPSARDWSWRAMRELAVRYRRFPLFSAPAALLNLGGTRLPVFMLAAFAGDAAVGHFGVAYGALAMPVGLVTGSVGQVFFVRAAEAHREGALAPLARRVLRGLVGVTAFPCLAVVAAGPTLYTVVFGPEWTEAGVYARLLAPWVLAASVASPLTSLFDVLGRQRDDLALSVVMASVTAAALVVAGVLGSATTLVAAGSAAGTCLRLGQIGWMARLAGVPAGAVTDVARAFAPAVPLAALVWLADAANLGGAGVLAVTVVCGALALALAGRQRRDA